MSDVFFSPFRMALKVTDYLPPVRNMQPNWSAARVLMEDRHRVHALASSKAPPLLPRLPREGPIFTIPIVRVPASLERLIPALTNSPSPFIGSLDDTAWSDAYCINTLPLPFSAGSRPTYGTMLECVSSSLSCRALGETFNSQPRSLYRQQCKGAYAGQVSGKCLSMLDSPPTMSPTTAGGLDVWYADYTKQYAVGECINDRPLPIGRVTYTTQLACCKGQYGAQSSGYCLSQLASPPTTSPTTEVLNVYYPDRTKDYADGVCTNDRPVPSGATTYTSQTTCCSANYSSQQDSTCFCDIDSC